MKLLILALSSLFAAKAVAATEFDASEVPQYGSYFTVSSPAAGNKIFLTKWDQHDGDPEQSALAYDRKKNFGGWIIDPGDSTCFNTRGRVLVRESLDPVKVSQNNECLIDLGRWQDPYSNITATKAREIQIDHLVPLKNAFISGAWKWSQAKRCAYTNFMGNKFHLIPVDSFENLTKSDQAPDEYIPPNKKYVCVYLQNWLKIKTIWSLTMTPPETKAIQQAITDYRCDTSQFVISTAELSHQRSKVVEAQNICLRQADLELRQDF